MLQFDAILGSIHDLSDEEKLKLRLLLDKELKAPKESARNSANRAKRIIGLFADEPDLMDRVMEAAYERRSRPWRVDP